MHTGLNALTRRSLGAIAISLALTAITASADVLFLASNYNLVNSLAVDSSIYLQSGENQGWWSGTFPNDPDNYNYYVGLAVQKNADNTFTDHYLNNFFIFDISSLTAPVTSAELNLQFFHAVSNSGASSLYYSLFDVSTDLTLLNAHTGGITNGAIYNDLGSGKSYGSFLIPVDLLEEDVVTMTLSSDGLADLNAAIIAQAKQFAIGGTLYPSPAPEQQNSVPDSGNTLVLLGLAAAGIWSIRNRKPAA